jgi:hypothetical protein
MHKPCPISNKSDANNERQNTQLLNNQMFHILKAQTFRTI